MEKQSLRDLWAHELEDLWTAEQAMLDALPAGGNHDDEVRAVFRQHQAKVAGHVERLREIFKAETLAQRSKGRPALRQRRPNRRAKRSGRESVGA
jgi:ferritin-like metal-binding protein YciE